MKKFVVRFFATIGVISFLPIFIILVIKLLGINIVNKVNNNSILEIDLSKKYSELAVNNWKNLINGNNLSFLKLLQLVQHAKNDKRVKGIVFKTENNSLGIAQMQEFCSAIDNFKQAKKDVWSYAYSFGELSSGIREYYLASHADKIWLQEHSFVNLSGMHIDKLFFTKLLNKYGITPQVFARKEYKNAFAQYTDEGFSPYHREATENLLQNIYNHFVNEMLKNRQISRKMFDSIFTKNPIIDDQSSVKHKLIDVVGSFEDFHTNLLDHFGKDSKIISESKYYNNIAKDISKKGTKVAIIYIDGVISQNSDAYDIMSNSKLVSAQKIAEQFNAVLKNKSIKAVLLRINTPGGSTIGSEMIRSAIIKVKKSGIPVIASVSNVSASGGVWSSSVCNHIVANETSITGSIGVIVAKLPLKGLLNNMNMNIDSISIGANSSINSMLLPYNAQQELYINKIVDLLYQRFLMVVAQGRKLPVDEVSKIAKGRVWTGLEARKFKLIDQLGGFLQAIDIVRQELKLHSHEQIQLVEITEKQSFIQKFNNIFTGGIMYCLQTVRLFLSKGFNSLNNKAIVQNDLAYMVGNNE